MTVNRSVVRRVRAAARVFDSAVVELGPGGMQLRTYCAELVRGAEGTFLALEPIAADALPLTATGPITIRCNSARGPFRLTCRSIERRSPTRAHVDLAHATIENQDARTRRYAVPSHRPLSLVVPGGVTDSDAHVFPIVEISPSSCVVDTTEPIAPGQDLGLVEIVGERSVLRRAVARSGLLDAFCTADGSRRFRCTLRLLAEEATDSEGGLDVVAEPERVRRAMEFAALSNAKGSFEAPSWGQGSLRFSEADRDSLQLVLLPAPHPSRAAPQFLTVRFELFAVGYEASLRVLERSGGWVRTAMPLHLHRVRALEQKRRLSRAPGRALSLAFRNPVTGEEEACDVSALSLHDVSFELRGDGDLLWRGLPLENASIVSGEERIALGDVRVEAIVAECGRRLARASINRASDARNPRLEDLLSAIGHPQIAVHDGKSFGAMLAIYKAAGLFAPHMRRNLDPIMPAAKLAWHRLHRAGPDVVQTLQHGPTDAPDAAVTALRPWETAFVAQHFVSTQAQSTTAAGRLQLAYVDHVQSRPDGHHLVFFVKSDNRQMNAFYERFFGTTGTPEAIERRSVHLWCRRGDLPAPQAPGRAPRTKLGNLHASQEATVARAAERRLGVHGAAALSFLPGQFRIPRTRRAFAKVGLVRKRVCEIVSRRSVPVFALIEEITSPGVNFTWMLNATWIVPLHTELDTGGEALQHALAHVLDKPCQTPTGDVFLNVTDGVDENVLASAGFEKLAETYMYTMNRAGLNRYFYYTSDRYGEVSVRTELRELRRMNAAMLAAEEAAAGSREKRRA